MDFRPADVFKAWNSAFAGDPCKHNFLRHAPGMLYLYDPPDGEARPPYRYMPDATQPTWLVTNQMGWRGAPIEVPRGPKTIRIVFVGSSTTVGPPHLPFSYPELVGYWLNRWAESKKLRRALRGAERGAREHRVDRQCRHREERGGAAPARPRRLLRGRQPVRAAVDRRQGDTAESAAPKAPPATAVPGWLQAASRYSAIAARIRAAIGMTGPSQDGREWPKPDYKLQWPEGLDEADPDLAYPRLPVSLNLIQRDLDAMRTAVQPSRQRLRGELVPVDGEGRHGARPGPPQVHPRAAQQQLLPVPLSRHGAAGALPEPAARQVRQDARHPVHRHGPLLSARSRPVRRCRPHQQCRAAGCRPGSPSICCCRWSKSTWPTARGPGRPTRPHRPCPRSHRERSPSPASDRPS